MSDNIAMILVVEVKLNLFKEIHCLTLLDSKTFKQHLCYFFKTLFDVICIHVGIEAH